MGQIRFKPSCPASHLIFRTRCSLSRVMEPRSRCRMPLIGKLPRFICPWACASANPHASITFLCTGSSKASESKGLVATLFACLCVFKSKAQLAESKTSGMSDPHSSRDSDLCTLSATFNVGAFNSAVARQPGKPLNRVTMHFYTVHSQVPSRKASPLTQRMTSESRRRSTREGRFDCGVTCPQ